MAAHLRDLVVFFLLCCALLNVVSKKHQGKTRTTCLTTAVTVYTDLQLRLLQDVCHNLEMY